MTEKQDQQINESNEQQCDIFIYSMENLLYNLLNNFSFL